MGMLLLLGFVSLAAAGHVNYLPYFGSSHTFSPANACSKISATERPKLFQDCVNCITRKRANGNTNLAFTAYQPAPGEEVDWGSEPGTTPHNVGGSNCYFRSAMRKWKKNVRKARNGVWCLA